MRTEGLPRTLGAFRIEAVLGEGGSGIVYDATWGPRRVALKVVHESLAGTDRVRSQFLSEAQRLQTIAHPSVVKVLAVGELPDGRPYLAMERLEGETLAQALGRGPLPVGKALELFSELCGAVATLHDQGLIHRDLKPENVFIVGGVNAVLLDFGIAKELAAPASTTTMDGGVRGTPAYMAPERFFGQPAGVATDIYELAVILYAMLAGRLPWDDLADPEARLSPRPLVELANVPAELDVEIRRAMSTRAQNRPATAIALRNAVGQAAGSGSAPTAAETARMRPSTMDPPPGDAPASTRVPTGSSEPVRPTVTAERRPWFEERQNTTDRGKTPLAWMPTQHATPPTPAPRRSRVPVVGGGLAVVALAGGLVAWRLSSGDDAPSAPVVMENTPPPAPGPVPGPAPTSNDPWAMRSGSSGAQPIRPEIEVNGAPIPVARAQKELDAAFAYLPPDTSVVFAATVAHLRADERFVALFTQLEEAPQAALFGDLVPHCIKELVSKSDWAVLGSPAFNAVDKATLIIRGRWDRERVDHCFRISMSTWTHDFVDDNTVFATVRNDLDKATIRSYIATPPGLSRQLRTQLAKLPSNRHLAWAVDGTDELEWPSDTLPVGSDSWAWLRTGTAKGGIALTVDFDVKDVAAAKTLEGKVRTPLDELFAGSTDASGRLVVTRAKSEVKISGTVSWLMMSMIGAALRGSAP
ncbi:MAG: protein kinase [Kofleriaceae bacterium]|nr:protein kinase [Kofleriaceae bacterium]